MALSPICFLWSCIALGHALVWNRALYVCMPLPTSLCREVCGRTKQQEAMLPRRMMLPADGLYYFQTEMPGDESVVGWGAVRSLLCAGHCCYATCWG